MFIAHKHNEWNSFLYNYQNVMKAHVLFSFLMTIHIQTEDRLSVAGSVIYLFEFIRPQPQRVPTNTFHYNYFLRLSFNIDFILMTES